MGELLAQWPSAALTLFARYGIGGRDKLGFRPQQPLEQVLRRYLIFDVESVLKRLYDCELEQRRFRISPQEFAHSLQTGLPLIDCRSAEEFRLGSLPGARLLDAKVAEEIAGHPVLLFDQNGPMAGAAAIHLAQRKQCHPKVLEGGLLAWSLQIDPLFPVVGGERVRILPDPNQLRLRCAAVAEPLEGDPQLVPFSCLRLWRSQDYLAVLRDNCDDWPAHTHEIGAWLENLEQHPWKAQNRSDPTLRLRQALEQDVQPGLQTHKGVVCLKDYRDGIAYVELGGGCQGCSSAGITMGQDVASALWRAYPELEGISDASDHDDPQAQPHH